MKKIMFFILVSFFAFLNAQGSITNTVGTNDATTTFNVLNPNGNPLMQIQGNGWTGFGKTPPMYPFHVTSDYYDDAGDLIQPTGFFENTAPNADAIGVVGVCANTDHWGIGVAGISNYIGIIGEVESATSDNDLEYVGTIGTVYGGEGLNSGVGGAGYDGYRAYGGNFLGHAGSYKSYGVRGEASGSPNNYGIYGQGAVAEEGGRSYGVYGYSSSANDYNYGVRGYSNNASKINYGVKASAIGAAATNYGLYAHAAEAATNWAGYFEGNVNVTGDLTTSTATYKIDHPLDPENQYLSHSSVESSDMMNIYNGNVVLDGYGEAEIELPEWFEPLNKDFRYQLTAIGAPGPDLFVADEISDNQFRIGGGLPGMKVSWQVTGIRKDAYANANRIQIEEDKSIEERGKYLNPEAFGLPREMGIDYEEEMEVEMEKETADKVMAKKHPHMRSLKK